MAKDKLTQKALKIGKERAQEILKAREKSRRMRAAALRARARRMGDKAVFTVATAAAARDTAGVLVAEGDSWFDYPFLDVLKCLEDEHGYDVESVAHKGDAIEEMAYDGQLDDFSRRVEKVLSHGSPLKAILLSGGGNDVAGDEFAMLLNHFNSPVAGFNNGVVDGVIDERIRSAYITILGTITTLCERQAGRKVPILIHGYDYPVPDGRGFMGGWWILPGPWLEPGFRKKGYADATQTRQMMKELIEHFNKMLKGVSALSEFAHVKFVDLRGVLSSGSNYKDWWANELHPTQRGFRAVTDLFARQLNAL